MAEELAKIQGGRTLLGEMASTLKKNTTPALFAAFVQRMVDNDHLAQQTLRKDFPSDDDEQGLRGQLKTQGSTVVE